MRLDEVPVPLLQTRPYLAQILCVQPSVTEVQLAQGIRTLAFDQIKGGWKPRLRCSCSATNFARSDCRDCPGCFRFRPASRRCPCQTALRRLCALPFRTESSLPTGTDHWLPASRLFRGVCLVAGNRPGESGRPDF